MLDSLFIFLVALFFVIKGATVSTKYATLIAQSFKLSKYTVGLIVIAIISILPETFIAINAGLSGLSSFGLGTLFGSNIADLTLIFAIIIFLTGRNLKIESKILQNNKAYSILLLLPLILGFDGHFSRIDGLSLIITGGVFYYLAFKNGTGEVSVPSPSEKNKRYKNIVLLLGGMSMLLIGAHFTVTSASELATYLGISPILIGMIVVGLGTTIPELFFSINSVKNEDDSMAVGDILGTVLADATIVVGILALVNPFAFPIRIIYITGLFMLGASVILFYFMKSGKVITKNEAVLLIFFWLLFVFVELAVTQ